MTQADIFNVGADFTAPDGAVYKLRKPTQYEQGEFQRWLEQRAHDAIDRGTESPEKKDKRHDRVYVDSALGKYEWEGPLATEAMWTPSGLAKILSIVCREQGMTDEAAEAAVMHSVKEIAAKILVRAADPKARADLALLLGALGLPMDWMASAGSDSSSKSCTTHPSASPTPNSPDSATTSSSSSTPSSAAPTG